MADDDAGLMDYADKTMVVDLPSGVTIIVAHAGQPLNTDRKYLKEHFGLDPDKGFRPDMIIPLSKSRQRPLTAAEKAAERAGQAPTAAALPKTARELELEADSVAKDALIAELTAQLKAARKPV